MITVLSIDKVDANAVRPLSVIGNGKCSTQRVRPLGGQSGRARLHSPDRQGRVEGVAIYHEAALAGRGRHTARRSSPDSAVFIKSGTLARYHTLTNGERQYLPIHIRGDMPDVQSLFLNEMDHSLCALDRRLSLCSSMTALKRLFAQRPNLGFACWRLTLGRRGDFPAGHHQQQCSAARLSPGTFLL